MRWNECGEWPTIAFALVAIVSGTNLQTPRFKEIADLVVDGIAPFWTCPTLRDLPDASVPIVACVQLQGGEIAWTVNVMLKATDAASFRATTAFHTLLRGTAGRVFALLSFFSRLQFHLFLIGIRERNGIIRCNSRNW